MARLPVEIPPTENAMVKGVARGKQGHRVGVYGSSVSQPGVWADGDKNVALYAAGNEKAAVEATSIEGEGVRAESRRQAGVRGTSVFGVGVLGKTPASGFEAVRGETDSRHAAVGAHSFGPGDIDTVALWAERHTAGGWAGKFLGNVRVEGTIEAKVDIVLDGGDCAEEFDIGSTGPVEPGTVMVLGAEGSLSPSERAYDRRAAGIVSGAGAYRPGLILDRKQAGPAVNRVPIALLGKVYCKVDASSAPIEIGDLLTTSSTPGHAMKASDPQRAFGAVIGKALGPLDAGVGLIPVLVSLQ